MRKRLLAWQWGLYPENHRDRVNLLLHLFTAPLFVGGTIGVLLSPALGLRSALSGLVAMVIPLALQGRGHKREGAVPVPFLGPMDFASRFLCEQFITFPRFVFSGGWKRALQAGQAVKQ